MNYSQLSLQVQTTILACICASFFLLYLLRTKTKRSNKRPTAPEARGAWPVIGHLHLFGGPQPPHINLGNIADKQGPIFSIKLGAHRALVVSSPELAKECLSTNDRVFASRPKSLAVEILGYNYAMFGFSPYGSYWRQARKIATLQLLSNHRLDKLRHVRESEVRASVKDIYQLWKEKKTSWVSLEMKDWFSNVMLNVMFKLIVGKRFAGATTTEESEANDAGRRAMREFFKFTGMVLVSDVFPCLRLLDIGGYEKAMKKTAKELDELFEGWLEEHKQKRVFEGKEAEEDFMDVMLSAIDDQEYSKQLPMTDLNTLNKAMCLTLILAGSDTTVVTLTWALSLLINNREVLKKAQHELDTQVGRVRQVEESDIKNLVYLQAIMKETFRLYPAGPLSVPHQLMEDCIVGGFHVPAGTRLIVNISKIHRNPHDWPNPSQFQPERFMTTNKDYDVRGHNFDLIPFSSGRRMCPGISLTLQVVHLILASLLHEFDIETPNGAPVDMSESSGLTNLKYTPLEVLLTPRLPANLYE